GTAPSSPRSRTADRNASTTTTCAARARAAATWHTSSATRSSRPADHTRRVDRPRRRHSLPAARHRLLAPPRASNGPASSSLTGPPGRWSPEQVLGTQLGDEGLGVGHRPCPVDPVLLLQA